MKEIPYKTFSFRAHKKNWIIRRPNVCQFELTFGCGLHCKHCYTDCYNRSGSLDKELTTAQVKFILDKIYNAGSIWLCFTGGDPLTRKDFLEIYSYAREKGFIITIFTNAYSMNEEIAEYLKKSPPFVIEMTLNGITKETYENISQVNDSFEKAMSGINLMIKANIPLKIKTQVTKENLKDLPEIKKFIQGLGLKFRPSYNLHGRLDGDLGPCNLRISAEEILGLNKNNNLRQSKLCSYEPRTTNHDLFRCAIGGGDGINLDPYGNIFLCNLIRKPAFSLLEVEVNDAVNRLLPLTRERKFTTDSRCKDCNLRERCQWCPGRALVETGDMETQVEYYCELAKLSPSL